MLIPTARLCQEILPDPDFKELGHWLLDAREREKVAAVFD
jgi:hypothetical protein